MSEYYLISQLPSLDGVADTMPIPITEERFYELCNRFLSKRAIEELNSISLVPDKLTEITGSALIDAWNEQERDLRLALGKIRAEKMKKSFDGETRMISVALMQTAHTAAEIKDPLEAEKFLNAYRLESLEAMRPMDNFSQDFVFYYCLKLKLLLRIRTFEAGGGEAAYKNIYNSIMNRERVDTAQ